MIHCGHLLTALRTPSASQVSDSEETLFERKLRERREAQERANPAATPASRQYFDSDLVPDSPYEKTEMDEAINAAVSRIDIIDAYNKYIHKSKVNKRNGQTESIMISCPNPSHTDKKPSAWLNTAKQTGYCEPCGIGFDAYDFAAISKGLSWPLIYKGDGSFPELKRQMAADFGFVATVLPGGAVIIAEPEPDDEPASKADIPDTADIADKTDILDTAADAPPTATAASTHSTDDTGVIELFEAEKVYIVPPIDWNKVIIPGTFLDEYMKCTRIDDVPEEFHFFHGLIALGLALGKDVRLYDSRPVYGNLFICTLGRSGSGKSKAHYYLGQLLNKALPYKHSDPFSKGTRKISAPGSAEVLIYNFQKPVTDPSDPKTVLFNAPVRGLIDYNELSSLLSRSNRMGSAIKPTMMQFYDMESVVATSSLTTGLKEATDPFASAITSTQPKALKDLLKGSDDSSGFLNRWAFILGTSKKRFAVGGAVVDVTPAVKPLEDILGYAATFGPDSMDWSPEALKMFTNFFHKTIEVDKERFDTDLFVRLDLLLKKLILLFTANVLEKVVPVHAVESAIALYDFLVAGYAVPSEEVGNTIASEMQDAIMSVALKQYRVNGKGVSLRQLAKSLWRRKYNHEQLLRCAEALVKIGYLKLETAKAGDLGRPTVRYKYVD